MKVWQTASQLEGTAREWMSGSLCKEAAVRGTREQHQEERPKLKLEARSWRAL